MTHIQKIIVILSTLFVTDVSNAMMAYAHLQKGSDLKTAKKLFILGEIHSGPESHDIATATDVEQIMNYIKRLAPQEPIAFLLEIPETPVDKMENPPSPVIDSLNSYVKRKDFIPLINVIHADRRTKEDFLIGGALNVVTDFSEEVQRGNCKIEDLVEILAMAAMKYGLHEYGNITVADYFKKLDADFDYLLCSLRDIDLPGLFVQTTLLRWGRAKSKIQEAFAAIEGRKTNDVSLSSAVLNIFRDCKTFDDLTKKRNMVAGIFYDLLVPIADIGFMEKMLSLYKSGTKRIILAVGYAHYTNLLKECESSMGFQVQAKGDRSNDAISNTETRNRLSRDCMKAIKHFLASSDQYCSWCLKEQKEQNAKRCSVCKQSFYCDVNCQRQDWPEHKKSCIVAAIG